MQISWMSFYWYSPHKPPFQASYRSIPRNKYGLFSKRHAQNSWLILEGSYDTSSLKSSRWNPSVSCYCYSKIPRCNLSNTHRHLPCTVQSPYLVFWGFLRHSTGNIACLYSGSGRSSSRNWASLPRTSSFDTRTGSSSLLLLPVCIERHDACGEGQKYGQWTEESARRILWPAATV